MRSNLVTEDMEVLEVAGSTRPVEIDLLVDELDAVKPGAMFFCVRGTHVDGHAFGAEAVARGAVALVVEEPLDLGKATVPQFVVTNTRSALSAGAAAFWHHPARHMLTVGITGTNGKTTTAAYLASILREWGRKTEVIGTITNRYTSPPPLQLHALLDEFRAAATEAVVMEVSSHASAQHRMDAITFDVAIFTNLTQDHLDFHHTMEEYFEAKARLFEAGHLRSAVVNVDDPYGERIVDLLGAPCVAVTRREVESLRVEPYGTAFVWRDEEYVLPSFGDYNVMNAICAIGAAKLLDIPTEVVQRGLRNLEPVPGRLQSVANGQNGEVIVDFAHTPDGLENVLRVAREKASLTKGKVVLVFGAGGDRDREKRPKMGAVAERWADEILITSDNPRSEDPAQIAKEVLEGFQDSTRARIILDRSEAILAGITKGSSGDVVIIAGKGHEAFQEIKGVRHPFDDASVARATLDELTKQPVGGAR